MIKLRLGLFCICCASFFFSASSAQAAVVKFLNDEIDGVDFSKSIAEYIECLGQSPTQFCFKMLWDPPGVLTQGTLTVDIFDIEQVDDASRIGQTVGAEAYHDYIGDPPSDPIRTQFLDRFEVPVIKGGGIIPNDGNIFEITVQDTGLGAEDTLLFVFSAENVFVQDLGDPTSGPVPAEAIPHEVLLVIPEPASLGSFVVGMLGLALFRRRRNRHQ